MASMLTASLLENDTSSAPPVRQHTSSLQVSQFTPLVFVVDPDRAVRESLERLIRCAGWLPETFTSAEEFLDRPLEFVASCLMLDVSLPGLSGLELQQLVAAERPDIPIIFLSTKCDVPTTVKAMKAGAAEFFAKPGRDEELLRAIREAHEWSRIALVQEAERQVLQRCYASLSRRERQVMTLVSAGLLNKQIGGELGISEITVKAHRAQMMQKMRAGSVADLVKMADKLAPALSFEIPMRSCA